MSAQLAFFSCAPQFTHHIPTYNFSSAYLVCISAEILQHSLFEASRQPIIISELNHYNWVVLEEVHASFIIDIAEFSERRTIEFETIVFFIEIIDGL